MGLMKRLGGSGGGRNFFEVQWFFDKAAVISAVDKATRRVLSRFGAFVRSTARRSIRKPRRKRINELTPRELGHYRKTGVRPFASADPGKPPRNQTGKLKGSIFFWYDRYEQSVTIGPASFGGWDRMGALEHGGMTMARARVFRVRAHPFMRPALAKELPKLDDLWRNSVRSGI